MAENHMQTLYEMARLDKKKLPPLVCSVGVCLTKEQGLVVANVAKEFECTLAGAMRYIVAFYADYKETEISFPLELKACEKLAITKAIEVTADNRKNAAILLGIGERTLYRKLKEYHLSNV